jgi:cytochrome c
MKVNPTRRTDHEAGCNCSGVSWDIRIGGVGTGCCCRRNIVPQVRALPCHRRRHEKVGPELNGLDGRKAGMVEGFNYSDANKNSGITWNEAVFKDYIKDPRAKVPGTKMIFAGIKNDKELDDLWSYVKQFAADGQKR